MLTQPRISLPRQALAEFCRRNRIRHLGLFGSVLRDDFRADSDVDVLVEFEPDTRVSLFTLVDLQDELAALLGRPVDLVPRDGLMFARVSEAPPAAAFNEGGLLLLSAIPKALRDHSILAA